MLVTFAASCQSMPSDYENDYWTETGYVLSPSDREARDLSLDFPQLDEDSYAEVRRPERDSGFHGRHGGGRQGGSQRRGRNNRRQQQEQEFVPEERQGRQSGGVGVALGVLNNPPREDGAYNFKYKEKPILHRSKYCLFPALPMMTAAPDRRWATPTLTPCSCPAATATSPPRESWWRCSTLRMRMDTTPPALTCPPLLLLPLTSRGCWLTLQRSTVPSSTRTKEV